MNNIEISEDKLEEFKNKLADYYLYEIYSNEFEVADRIRQLRELETNPTRIKTLADINDRLKVALEEKDRTARIALEKKDGKYKDKKASADEAEKAIGTVEKIKFEKSRYIKQTATLYQELSHYAEQADIRKKSYLYVKTFDPNNIEKLSYAEIDGTRYALKDNILAKDTFGQMVLFLEPAKNDQNNTYKTSSES